MKKILLILTSTLFCMYMTAAFRTQEEAMRLAASLDGNHQVARVPAHHPQALTHCYTALQESGQPAVYVFNRGEDDGFVLISADDRARTVLAYSDEGHWDAGNMPDATRSWLNAYCKDISRVASAPVSPLHAPVMPAKVKKQKQYTAISPICQTKWGQRDPYNLLCPTYNGSLCVTGCVATAAAQIMKVHAYPTRGTGTYSYGWVSDTGDTIMLSADLGATTYKWSQMLNTYPSTATTAQKNAVATLMYHCGVVSEMGYSPTGSGTSNNQMLAGMVNHFGYDPGVGVLIKDCMRESDMIDSLAAEFQQGRPVMFSARTIEDTGHAFVGDGIDANGLIHINWGWYGTCDGYFHISAMDPDNQGTGGSLSNEAYTEQVIVYTHIRPMANGSYHYTIMSDTVYPYQHVVEREQGWVALQADVFHNMSLTTLSGTISALKVYDANGDFLTYCDYEDWSYDGLQPGYYYYSQYVIGYVSDLPVGNYYISPAMKANGEYVPIQVKGYSDYRCAMQITEDYIYLNDPEPEPEETPLNAYDYTELLAFRYPHYANYAHYWAIQLSTEDFYEDEADENQMLLLFDITTASPRSFAGSFIQDTTSYYRLLSAGAYKGNINSYTRTPIENCELTIAYNNVNNVYTVYYNVRVDGKDYTGQADVSVSHTFAYFGEDYQSYVDHEQIIPDHTHYTGITVSQAIDMMSANEVGWVSAIPYIIEGEISSLNNTPAQIVQYGNCRLYLSDGEQSIYGYNTKWLNNQSYPTGNEIAVGGVAAIIGKIKYYSTSTKEIDRGYFYQYGAPGTEREYGLMTDMETADYYEIIDSYEVEIHPMDDDETTTDFYAHVEASNDDAWVVLNLFPASGESTLSEGTYIFSDVHSPFTALRGYGVNLEDYIVGAFASLSNEYGRLGSIWYPRNGNVTVSADGVITVNATNSFGQSIYCRLNNASGTAIEQTNGNETTVQKIVRKGQLFILRNGTIYTVQGVRVNE